MKRQRLTKHLELPKLYEESRLSSESTSFESTLSINCKNAYVGKWPERVKNVAKSPLTILYEIRPNHYDDLSFILQEVINVKFGG